MDYRQYDIQAMNPRPFWIADFGFWIAANPFFNPKSAIQNPKTLGFPLPLDKPGIYFWRRVQEPGEIAMKLSPRIAQFGLIATIAILILGMTVVFVGSTEGRPQPTPQNDGVASVSHNAQH
jgi:hypothetical protein